ncbi:hypothetical protein [Paenibacillus sp. FSL L8-0709]|uniref:hypothetical protein n=1 Tax=Paenibacillus sp. FSL L8-0709 TaxID=2975312 RepID=UPI0030FA0E7A
MNQTIEQLIDKEDGEVVLTKEYIERNPSIIGEQITDLAKAVQEIRGELQGIKNRTWWEKLGANNTRDLAEALIKQNDTISSFISIIQGIIFLATNNTVVLAGIMQAIEKKEVEDGISDNKYVAVAKDYLSEAIITANKVQNNEKTINEMRTQISYLIKKQRMNKIVCFGLSGITLLVCILVLMQ